MISNKVIYSHLCKTDEDYLPQTTLGETDGFAKGEDIRAVRFSGDTTYVIMFENTDHLFVLDLSNPKEPIIKEKVKISGFSTSLIPIDSDTLLV